MARDEEIQSGKKRPAPGDPEAQPLAKRFGRLQIDNSLPISARAKSKGDDDQCPPSDTMLLDDTQHTTYVHDLEQELAEIESPGLVFSSFAAKVLSVPHSVLSTTPSGKELVLYTEPSSLTIPPDKDSVRKAIIESRARARAQEGVSEGSSVRKSMESKGSMESTESTGSTDSTEAQDGYNDPMEID